jgi:pilus assembly protein CpaE
MVVETRKDSETVPDQSNRTRVVAITDPGPGEQQIAAALNSQADFVLADLVTAVDKAAHAIRVAQPQIVLVDFEVGGQPTVDSLDDLALQFPDVALVAILPDGDPSRTQQVMLAGARAFLIQPFTQVNLVSTLRRVRDLEARRTHARPAEAVPGVEGPPPLRIISVFGPRGGVGTSTVALNLALAMEEATSQRVLLVEGKLLFGHLDLMLNLRTRNSIADLLPHAHHLDENLLRDVVVKHASGVHVLLAPGRMEVAQGVRPEPLFAVLDGLRRFYDYLILDAGSALTDNSVTQLDLADRVLLLATPEMAALHDVSRFIQLSRDLAYLPGKVLTVLNRADMPGGLQVKDIQGALHHDLFAQVPDGGDAVLRSLNRGLPLLFRYPRNPAARGIQRLAASLLRLAQAQPAGAAASPAAGRRLRRVAPEKVLAPKASQS